MNVSLILLFLAMWVLGHVASTKRNYKLVNFRRRRPHSGAATSPHENTGCRKVNDAANPAAELLVKANRYAREGKPLEARLCRKAALELDAIDRDRSQRSGNVVIKPAAPAVEPATPLRSERSSEAA